MNKFHKQLFKLLLPSLIRENFFYYKSFGIEGLPEVPFVAPAVDFVQKRRRKLEKRPQLWTIATTERANNSVKFAVSRFVDQTQTTTILEHQACGKTHNKFTLQRRALGFTRCVPLVAVGESQQQVANDAIAHCFLACAKFHPIVNSQATIQRRARKGVSRVDVHFDSSIVQTGLFNEHAV